MLFRLWVKFSFIIAAASVLICPTQAEQTPEVCADLQMVKKGNERDSRIDQCIHALREIYNGDQKNWPTPNLTETVTYEPLGPLPDALYTPENPHSELKEKLGKQLFSDPRLSKSGQIACAHCHHKELGFTDRLRNSFGHDRQKGNRNAISIVNTGFYREHFWDGRAGTLEDQALAAMTNPIEMAADPNETVDRVKEDEAYTALFADVYGDDEISLERLLQSLVVYVRSENRRSRFDLFMEGRRTALKDDQLWGLHLFRTKARCMNCHNGSFMTDQKYHNLGLHFYGRKNEDLGRYNVTDKSEDVGAFRTPSLRNISNTGPWMHMGTFSQLKFIINVYNAGGYHPKPKEGRLYNPPFPQTSPLLEKLNLTKEEKGALNSFLEAL